jgi:hypothetical protein
MGTPDDAAARRILRHALGMLDERWDELADASVGGVVTRGTMFGSPGLRTGRRYFATWWHSQLVLKLPSARIEELVSAGHGVPFEPMPGRPMTGWVVVDSALDWAPLVDEAEAYVTSQQP